jgi:hypothetical protein
MELQDNDQVLLYARKTAHEHGPIATILGEMNQTGYWVRPGPGYNPKYRSTVWSVIMLAQLGASIYEDKRVEMACNYLLENNLTQSGQFTSTGTPSGTIDCLQGNLCRALLDLGCNDPRLMNAYNWMACSVTGEGIASRDDSKAAMRYYAYNCGPTFACGVNNKLPCGWGAAKVMSALGKLQKQNHTPAIKKAIQHGVDFLFSIDPADANYPTAFNSKPSRAWWKFGFPIFYVTDLLQVVEALVSLGYGEDPRLSRALTIIREKQDADGRWALDYDYAGKTWLDFGLKKQPNKWVTLRALRVIKDVSKDFS